MKKKIYLALAISAIVLIISVISIVRVKNSLFYQNVEALSRIEEGQPGTGVCYNSIRNKEGQYVLYCGSCTYLKGTSGLFASTGTCY